MTMAVFQPLSAVVIVRVWCDSQHAQQAAATGIKVCLKVREHRSHSKLYLTLCSASSQVINDICKLYVTWISCPPA